MDALPLPARAAAAAGAVAAVQASELAAGVRVAPPEQKREEVAEPRVLVRAHDGKERVEHLVRRLRPPPAPPRAGHGGVERPRHEQEHERDARGDEGEPHEERRVRGVPRPGLAPAAQGAAVHGAVQP